MNHSLRHFLPYKTLHNHLHLPHLTPLSQLHSLTSPPAQDPHALLTHQDPIQTCTDIWVKCFSTRKNKNTKPFPNLTGFLSKFDLWVLAYQRSLAHFTGTFPPRNAIATHTLHDLLSLRNAVVKGEFCWNGKSQMVILGPGEKPMSSFGSMRRVRKDGSVGVAPFQDHVVQEVLLLVLEPVFESRFSRKNHGFRPGRNAHTVIRTIRSNFARYVWYVKGDVSEILEGVDRCLVMSCLGKFVKDKVVLGLIGAALRGMSPKSSGGGGGERKDGGVKRNWKKKKKSSENVRRKVLNPNEPKPDPYWLRTFYGFAPEEAAKVPSYGHCGILSPLLANVCLNELDEFMEGKILEFLKPSMIESRWKQSGDESCHNPSWPEFVPSDGKEVTRKLDYIRYGGHFLVGIQGSRKDALEIKEMLIEFCWSKLGIKLDNSKLEVEHVSRGVLFLDHVICHRVIYPTLHYTGTGGKVVSKKGVGTLLSVTASLPQCIRNFRRLDLLKGDKDPEPLPCTPMLYSSQAHTNSQMNKLLEMMADWFIYADNRKKVVAFCAYVIRSSVAKLYAARYKLKSRAKVYKLASRDLRYPIRKRGINLGIDNPNVLSPGVVDVIEGLQFSRMSLIPSCDYSPFPYNWVPEHEQILLEYIKLQDPKVLCDLQSTVKARGLSIPQDQLSEIVQDFKTVGVRRLGLQRAVIEGD